MIMYLHSIQDISVQYETGDLPVLVLCSDGQLYICKYMRPNATIAYKLACEFIGTLFAEAWRINTPPFAIIQIKPAHWASISTPHSYSAPAIGFRKIDGVIDITPTTYQQVKVGKQALYQLLKIALFDFWIANEDRTYNNANLLYQLETNTIISIDYGGILNNVSFDYPLTQLTETDSILCADIFAHISCHVTNEQLKDAVSHLQKDYQRCLLRAKEQTLQLANIPKEWNVPITKIQAKANELFSDKWIEDTWTNFVECLKQNSNYGR